MVKRRKTFKFRISFGIINHLDSTQEQLNSKTDFYTLKLIFIFFPDELKGLKSHSNSSKTYNLPDDLLCKNILMKPTYASTGNGPNMNSEGYNSYLLHCLCIQIRLDGAVNCGIFLAPS